MPIIPVVDTFLKISSNPVIGYLIRILLLHYYYCKPCKHNVCEAFLFTILILLLYKKTYQKPTKNLPLYSYKNSFSEDYNISKLNISIIYCNYFCISNGNLVPITEYTSTFHGVDCYIIRTGGAKMFLMSGKLSEELEIGAVQETAIGNLPSGYIKYNISVYVLVASAKYRLQINTSKSKNSISVGYSGDITTGTSSNIPAGKTIYCNFFFV